MVASTRLIRLFAFVFFLVKLGSSASAQQTIRVPQDASSIQGGINAANPGDTVLVSPGTYNENIDFHGKAITVTSGAKSFTDAATTSTIINGTADGPVANFSTGETSAAVLNGFTIQNGHSSVGSSSASGGISIVSASPTITNNVVTNNIGTGIQLTTAGSPLIQGNDIRNTTGVGTTKIPGGAGTGLALSGLGNIQIIGNTIENNVLDDLTINEQTACGAGVYIGVDVLGQTYQVLLKNNIIRNNQGNCSPGFFQIGVFSPPNLTLVQNLIYGNTGLTASVGPQVTIVGGQPPYPYPSLTEINNTIYGPGGQHIVLYFGASTVTNNIFFNSVYDPNAASLVGTQGYNSGLWCDSYTTSTSPVTLNNNDIFNVDQLQDGGCKLSSGNLSVDPQFLNPSASDFHTQPTSPIVAAGTITAPDILPADLDAKARTVCNTIDMGVYEIRPHPPIVLTVTPNPAPGQSTVTLTAPVTGNCNTPTGTIVFLDGTTVLGSAPLSGAAVPTFSTSFLFVGTHNLTATYAGDFNFDNSVSNTITEVITGPPTTTILNSLSPNPAQPLQPVTMIATVSSAYTVPSGTVTFMAGGAVLASATVGANGVASGVATSLHAGTYLVTAVYGGSTEYAASTSNALTLAVLAGNTTTSLSAAPKPAAPGQSIILAAQVSGALSGIPLTGTVTFKEGATILGTANVGTNGLASFSIATLLTGTHSITSTYGGSSDYNGSTSQSLAVNVTTIPTSIGLNVSPNPATAGQTVTMVATAVVSLANQTPTGTVTFSDQTGTLGTTPLVNGVATFATTTLSTGTHQITATLNPTGFFGPSTSAVVTEVINDFNFALAVSSTSLTLPSGDYEVLSVTVTPSGGFADAVTLGCNSVPDHAQCVFSPQTTQALSGGAQTVKLTRNTSDVLDYGNKVGSVGRPHFGFEKPGTPLLAGILFPFVTFCSLIGCLFRRSNVRLQRLLLLVAVAALNLTLQACSGQLPRKTPPGTYTITVTATDAGSETSLTQSVNLHLTVTP
jgi:parallel beta-helix repeat protein